MNVKKLQCPGCHASLEMDMNNLKIQCPYCRTRLTLDFDVDNYISETEETKRNEAAMKNIEAHYRYEHREKIIEMMIPVGAILLLFIFAIGTIIFL